MEIRVNGFSRRELWLDGGNKADEEQKAKDEAVHESVGKQSWLAMLNKCAEIQATVLV